MHATYIFWAREYYCSVITINVFSKDPELPIFINILVEQKFMPVKMLYFITGSLKICYAI